MRMENADIEITLELIQVTIIVGMPHLGFSAISDFPTGEQHLPGDISIFVHDGISRETSDFHQRAASIGCEGVGHKDSLNAEALAVFQGSHLTLGRVVEKARVSADGSGAFVRKLATISRAHSIILKRRHKLFARA